MRALKAFASLLFVLLTAGAEARDFNAPNGPHVATLGHGRVTVPADRAIVELTARATEPSAAVAKNGVERMVTQLLASLGNLNVSAADYSSGGLRLDRQIDYRGVKEILLGYIAERDIRISLRDTALIDTVLQAALKAGITQVNSVEFTLSTSDEIKQRARGLAAADAKQKAQFLAAQFGGCLADIYSIDTSSDGNDGTLSEIVVTASKREDRNRIPEFVPGQYDAGQVDVRAQLFVVFNLKTGGCP